jgi:hypothetical protein
MSEAFETDLTVGPRAIDHYSRLSYTMWYALAEFVDNSTQSRANYSGMIDLVLKDEGQPLTVDIVHSRTAKTLTISDNSIGMNKDALVAALKIGYPTQDSKGRSKYGMGMKTAACWIGRTWQIVTCEWDSGIEWTAHIDVDAIANKDGRVQITSRAIDKKEHYTKIIISDLRRVIQTATEAVIKAYLGSMYMFDLRPTGGGPAALRLTYNGEEVLPPSELEWDTDISSAPMRKDLPEVRINGKWVKGWIGVLKKGGRKFGGFSLFQNERQIQGFPHALKPRSIFGGVDEEGANNLIAQRLTGVLLLDPNFVVSHTKDAILFQDDEEFEFEKYLIAQTKDYRDYAQKRRGTKTQSWSKEKLKDLVEGMRKEFTSDEMKDAIKSTQLPPIEAIVASNQERVSTLTADETIATLDIATDFSVVVSVQEKSEFDPYVTFATGAKPGVLHVIINGLHPYYVSLETNDAIDECVHQYLYDAVAEYRTGKLTARINPDSVKRVKDGLLRVGIQQAENALAESQAKAETALLADEKKQA